MPSIGTCSSAGKVRRPVTLGVALDQLDCLDHRPVMFVVGPKLQHMKDVRHHLPVMPLIGISGHGAQRGPIFGRRLSLFDKVLQGLLARDREYDVTHNPVRLIEHGAGDIE